VTEKTGVGNLRAQATAVLGMLTPERLKPLAKENDALTGSTHRIDLPSEIMDGSKLMRLMSHIWDYLEFYVNGEFQITLTKGEFWHQLHTKLADDPSATDLIRHELTCDVFIQSQDYTDGTPIPMFVYEFQL
jgi:hypothetical protein